MIGVRCLLAVLVVLGFVSVTRAQTFACGGAGYNLSTIGDLTTTVNGYTWTVNPCRPITTGSCSGKNATFCQGPTVLNYYNPLINVVTWTTITGGVMSRSINGADSCSLGTSVRTAAVEYLCNATATTAFLSNVEEVETCQYLAQVQTSLVCAAPIAVSASPVGLPFSSNTCGGGLFDLTSIDVRDFVFTASGNSLVFRPCTPVNTSSGGSATSGCPAGTSFCQSNGFSLSAGNGLAQTYTLQPDGLLIQSQDGSICGNNGNTSFGWPREANVYLQCNASAIYPQYVPGSWFEGSNTGLEPVGSEYCHYTVTIQTAAVCTRLAPTPTTTAPLAAPTFACGGAGVDLSLIAAVDMTFQRPYPLSDVFWVNPCRALTQSPCAGQGASVCQALLTGGGNYNSSVLSYLNPAYAPIQWSTLTYNGAQAVQSYSLYGDIGSDIVSGCNTRSATVIYYCAPASSGGALSRIMSVTETSVCQFTIAIATTVVCSGSTALVARTAIGYPFTSNTCGGGLYNLATLDSFDFQFNTSSTQAYWWRPCSPATSWTCSAANATFCQYNGPTGNPTSWALAVPAGSTPNAVNTYTLQPSGLLIQSQDGTMCNSIPRAATTLLVCNQTATSPYLLSYSENSGRAGFVNNGQAYCHYELILATNQVCPAAVAPSNSTSTSSSSGGTVVVPPGGGGSAGSSSSAAAAPVVARSSSSAAAAVSASASAGSSSSAAAPVVAARSSSSVAVVTPVVSSSAGTQAGGASSSAAGTSGTVVSTGGGSPPVIVGGGSSSAAAPQSSAAPAAARSSSSSSSSSSSAAASSSSSSSSSTAAAAAGARSSSSSSSSTAAGASVSSSSSSSTGSSAPVVVGPFATSSSSDIVSPPIQNVNGAVSTSASMAAVVCVAMVAASMALLL